MTPIKTTAIYGLGALGMLFGSKLQDAYGPENVKFVMDSARYARHRNDRYTINGEPFVFALQDALAGRQPASDPPRLPGNTDVAQHPPI